MIEETHPGQFVYKTISVKDAAHYTVDSHLVGKRFYSIDHPLGSGRFQIKFVDEPEQIYKGEKVRGRISSENGMHIVISTKTRIYEIAVVGGYGLQNVKKPWKG